MSTPVTYIGNQYNVPAYQDTGYAQGTGNLSSYLIALATGSLTLSGGSFPLTAEADFGGNYGLKSIYFKSRSTVSTAGVLRLGNTETIGWRDNANANNIVIACNATQTGGATYTIPDTGNTTASFVMTQGTQTISGAKTFASAVSLPNGTVSAPSLNLGDAATGLYRPSSNTINIALNGVRAVGFTATGTADDNLYNPIQFYGGGGTNACEVTTYSTTGVAGTPKMITAIDVDAQLLLVLGSDGAGNRFADVILATYDNTTPSVIQSKTSAGSPAARTYSGATNAVKLAMAAGTYTIKTVGFGAVFR